MTINCEISSQNPQFTVKRIIGLPQETFQASLTDIHESALIDITMSTSKREAWVGING